MDKKKHYMINLNICVNLIADLRESGRIDRETESLFVSLLYKAREFSFYKNPQKIKTLEQLQSELK
jgi:hypothetical protein